MTVVVDGSALVLVVSEPSDRGPTVEERLADGAVAPHIVDAELGQAVRSLVLRGLLGAKEGESGMGYATELVLERYPHVELRHRAWELRDNVSFYDGLYVALAEIADLPLLTADRKLAKAQGPRCQIEVM